MIILGAGNMGTNLAIALHRTGCHIECVYSRTQENARVLASRVEAPIATNDLRQVNRLLKEDMSSRIVFYCLTDSVLRNVAEQIDAPLALHIHTSGTIGLDVFDGTDKPHAGVLYPLQTLTKHHPISLRNVPIFIEGTGHDEEERVRLLAENISTQVYQADSARRRSLHLAGVFANNFTNCMYTIAGDILNEAGFPTDVLLPLIDETAARVHVMFAPLAQTGPARRGDENVMAEHLKMLDDENRRDIYQAVSRHIRCIANDGYQES